MNGSRGVKKKGKKKTHQVASWVDSGKVFKQHYSCHNMYNKQLETFHANVTKRLRPSAGDQNRSQPFMSDWDLISAVHG
jgi:hypothetical protein